MAKKGVKVIDRGWNKIVRELFGLAKGQGVAVGVQGEESQKASEEHDGNTNVEIAVVHEYGSSDKKHPPERSFLRSTFDEKRANYEIALTKLAKGVFSGGTVEGHLFLLGEEAKGDIIDKIKAGIPPALSETTKAQRLPGQGTTPLIKTGQLWNSITAAFVDPNLVRIK